MKASILKCTTTLLLLLSCAACGQIIPATPIIPIETFGEVPEEFADGKVTDGFAEGQPELTVEYPEDVLIFRNSVAQQYGTSVDRVTWLGETDWGRAVQVIYEIDGQEDNCIDIVLYNGQIESLHFAFDGGEASTARVYEETLVIFFMHSAGIFSHHIGMSRVPNAYELVVTGYDREGIALWRGAKQLW